MPKRSSSACLLLARLASRHNLTAEQIRSKLLLGFPCKSGSFMVSGYNHEECDPIKSAEVVAEGRALNYPLRGVFEWSAKPPTVYPTLLANWNAIMRAGLDGAPLPKLKAQPYANDDSECHTIAPPDSGVQDQWCMDMCSKAVCPEELCGVYLVYRRQQVVHLCSSWIWHRRHALRAAARQPGMRRGLTPWLSG